ncbi:hypothetical protein PT974_04435 [Cladobotryum mycophilum]|uniref:FAD-binding PCMH-type domain-containing protein n=1 Tax=Cladobotryum mycophilum TaxID=491253 RepID=A0ABR0SV25_9HYPO
MAFIQNVRGNQALPLSNDYELLRNQYATSSHDDNAMKPGLIVQPKDVDDIKAVIAHAKTENKAVAIRSGGHQYSGASSTGLANIQLDLRNTFKSRHQDLVYREVGDKSYVRTSVSWSLGDFNLFLRKHNAFVPHGQCAHVHVGGHAQTGGYGQLGRGFGLFGDHIISLEIVDHNGEIKEITRSSDAEQFFAWTGGSPGNLGVLTHFTVEVYRDSNYRGSRYLKCVHAYSPANLKRILKLLADMNDDEGFPRNYDLCVSVVSAGFDLMSVISDLPLDNVPDNLFGEFVPAAIIPTIIIYAQWVPFSADDTPNMSWFENLNRGSIVSSDVQEKVMSEVTRNWLFPRAREYDLPYVKRAYLTAATNLSTNGWVDWAAGRMDKVIGSTSPRNGHRLSAQLQAFGGTHSRFRLNANNGTSYSWRDSTLCFVLDDFHDPSKKQEAEQWAQEADREALTYFSAQDRRVLWGSYGSSDLHAVRAHYYDNEAIYQRLQRARSVADPNGTFTPNAFSVKRMG